MLGAENWNKFTIWFKPTGWRPENFEEKYPVTKLPMSMILKNTVFNILKN
jgi:hypothetical protein